MVYASGLRSCPGFDYKHGRPAGTLAAAEERQRCVVLALQPLQSRLYEIMIFKRRVCVASEVFALTRWAPPRLARRGSAAQVKMAR